MMDNTRTEQIKFEKAQLLEQRKKLSQQIEQQKQEMLQRFEESRKKKSLQSPSETAQLSCDIPVKPQTERKAQKPTMQPSDKSKTPKTAVANIQKKQLKKQEVQKQNVEELRMKQN